MKSFPCWYLCAAFLVVGYTVFLTQPSRQTASAASPSTARVVLSPQHLAAVNRPVSYTHLTLPTKA